MFRARARPTQARASARPRARRRPPRPRRRGRPGRSAATRRVRAPSPGSERHEWRWPRRASTRPRRRRSRRRTSARAARRRVAAAAAASDFRTAMPRLPRGRPRRRSSALADGDAVHHDGLRRRAVAAGDTERVDPLHRVHSRRDGADDRVVGRQAGVVAGDDEELATGRAGCLDLRLGHGHDALRVLRVGGWHVDRRVAGAARARLRRVAALDHEARHDAVEDRVVEVPVVGERDERGRRLRRELLVERDRERAAARVERQRVGLGRVEGLGGCRCGLRVARTGRVDVRALGNGGAGRRAARVAARGLVASAPASCGEDDRGEEDRQGAHGLRSYPSMPTVIRCEWATGSDELMLAHHDEEWGVPSHDDVHLFEMLTLEGAQAGLSWSTILRKREGYRAAFAEFDPHAVARFGAEDVERLLADPGIVRNRLKVESTVNNAARVLEVQEELGSLDVYLWGFVDGKPIVNRWRSMGEIPAETDLSKAISKDLKRRGFRFIGPTVTYAFMQSVGMVDDHTVDCFRYGATRGS